MNTRDVFNPFHDSLYTMGEKVIHNGVEMTIVDVYYSAFDTTWKYGTQETEQSIPFWDIREDQLYPLGEYAVAPGAPGED